MPTDPSPHRPPSTARSPLLYLAGAVALGILTDRLVGDRLPGCGLYGWWFAAAGCLLISWVLQKRISQRSSIGLLLTAVVCLGGGWHHLRWHYFQHDDLARFATEASAPVCLEAIALGHPKWKPAPPPNPLRAMPTGSSSEIQIGVTQLRDGKEWRLASGTCRLRIDGKLDQAITAGDRLLIFAQLRQVAPALNPGQYDWAQEERRAGRLCQLSCRSTQCVTVTQAATGSTITRWLNHLAQRCKRRLATYVDPDQSNLAQALLLGARERLAPSVVDAFRQTGTIHLLVVSGLHVGLLALAIWIVVCSGFLPRRAGLLLTALLVLLYALITGGRPPVIRATVLVILTLASYVVGRRVSIENLLAGAALVVLAINPSELFRSGTQLSFLCVAALGAYGRLLGQAKTSDPLTWLIHETQPWYRKCLRWAAQRSGQTAIASLVVWIVVAPLVAYYFHITAPISVLITPLLWPLVSVALTAGLAICTVGWLVPPLAHLLGTLCSYCLWGINSIVDAAQAFDVGSFYLPGPSTWWILVFYAGLMFAVLVIKNHVHFTWQFSTAALWIAVGLGTTGQKHSAEQLQCTFLSVGHGTCVVLQLPDGETILYDAGSLGSPDWAAATIADYLWSQGITHLDAVVLSHADVDHYNALPRLLDRFAVGTVYVSPLMFDPWINDGQLEAPNFLKKTLEEAQVPLREIWVNDRLRTTHDRVALEILHPPRRGVPGQDNANSLLLAVRFAGHSILLPGDLESPGIEAVMAEQPEHFDILLAPHHGSSRSDPPGFAAWSTPDWVIVSGRRASTADQQSTAQSYRQAGAQVLHTANLGAVTFNLSKNRLTCSTFRSGSTF